jgi:hypothetical protein
MLAVSFQQDAPQAVPEGVFAILFVVLSAVVLGGSSFTWCATGRGERMIPSPVSPLATCVSFERVAISLRKNSRPHEMQ